MAGTVLGALQGVGRTRWCCLVVAGAVLGGLDGRAGVAWSPALPVWQARDVCPGVACQCDLHGRRGQYLVLSKGSDVRLGVAWSPQPCHLHGRRRTWSLDVRTGIHHDLVLSAAVVMEKVFPETLTDSTLRENKFQQFVEYGAPTHSTQPATSAHCRSDDPTGQRVQPATSPAPLHEVTVDTHLGLVSMGNVDANFLRELVRFNTVKLPDDEAVQQDNSATSAMQVKRS